MATTVRIATFNCENLFARYKFNDPNISVGDITADGFEISDVSFSFYDDTARKLTAKAIKETRADVVALQEVENLDVLKRFRADYLGGFKAFPYTALIAGNDPRFIDVAVLSKLPLVHLRSYMHEKKTASSRSFIFSRDCLEVDVAVGNQLLTLYVNHLKSMVGGRAATRERRELQAQTVRRIVEDTFGSNMNSAKFIVLGDMNDYMTADPNGTTTGIADLVEWNKVENVVERLPAQDQWTHYYDDDDEYRQLDYILVSKALTPAVQSVDIVRKGMPLRAARYTGPRFPGVGQDRPKASDHCPVVVELSV